MLRLNGATFAPFFMFEFISADDWQILLEDGKVVEEGHNVPHCICLPCCVELIERYGITSKNFTSREATEEEYKRLEECGYWTEPEKNEESNINS